MIEGACCQELSRLIKPHFRNHAVVRRHRVNGLLLPKIPDLHRIVVARRCKLESVRRKAAAQHSLHMPLSLTPSASTHLQRRHAPSRAQVPHTAHTRLVARCRQTAVALEVQPEDLARVPVLQQQLLPRRHVPQPEGAVATHRTHEGAYASHMTTTATGGVELHRRHTRQVAGEGVQLDWGVVFPAPQFGCF